MKHLKKELGLLGLICVATGAMVSSGLFILPGLAFSKAGPAVIISYILAAIFCIPTLLSNAELTTAMPKAGGDYFYIMRGFGPLLGTVSGFSSWFSLSLKGVFALLGMGAYVSILVHMDLYIIAFWCCVLFIIINLIGVKVAVKFQIIIVLGLIVILVSYILWGMLIVNPSRFSPFFSKGFAPVFSTASFVFISYGGLTKVASLAEEVKNPGRNLPLGMILSLIITAVLYALAIAVTVGVLNPDILSESLMPISEGAVAFGGKFLQIIVSLGAFFAFISTANAGIMTASRYPLGMSRDKLLPEVFQATGSIFKTPYISVVCTGLFMILMILFFRIELLVKVASSILILMFLFANVTLILFRESKISSYRPKFRAPFYPYLQILGIIGCLFLLIEMGTFIVFLTMLFLLVGVVWFKIYGSKRATPDSVIIHVVERLVAKDKELVSDDLLVELKDIVMQRDKVVEDRFHKLIEESTVLDLDAPITMDEFFYKISDILAGDVNSQTHVLFDKFMQKEEESSTLIRPGLAIPHIIIEGEHIFKILLARAKTGIVFPNDRLAHIVFVLIGSIDERDLHLKVLAAIAEITQNPDFDKRWLEAGEIEDLKNVILLAKRSRGED